MAEKEKEKEKDETEETEESEESELKKEQKATRAKVAKKAGKSEPLSLQDAAGAAVKDQDTKRKAHVAFLEKEMKIKKKK